MVLQSGPFPTRRQPEGFMASLFLFIIKILLQVPHQKWPPNFTCVTWWTTQHRPLKESKCLSLRLLWAEQSLLWVLSLTKKAYEPQELQMAGQKLTCRTGESQLASGSPSHLIIILPSSCVVSFCCYDKKHSDQKQLGKETVYLPYISGSQSFIEGNQGRNSDGHVK